MTSKPKSKVYFLFLFFAAIAIVNVGPRSWHEFGWRVAALTIMAWLFHYALCYVFRPRPTPFREDEDMAAWASKFPLSSVQVAYSLLLYPVIFIGVFAFIFSLAVFILHWFYYALFQVEYVKSGVTNSWGPFEVAAIPLLLLLKGPHVIRCISGLVWLLAVKTFLTRPEVLECMDTLEQLRQRETSPYPRGKHPVLSPENKIFNLLFDPKQNGQK